jgi:RimJ/RimL family protein N-acetyltransferase
MSSSGNAFRSERLVYRAVEDTDFDKDWFHAQIQSDPVGFALGDSSLLRPQVKSRSDAKLAEIQKGLLGVIICLPAAADDAADPGSVPKPTPIGILDMDDDGHADNYRHHHRLAELGIALAAPYQNQGYGGEAIRWATDWAFERANIHAVSLGCVEYNERGKHLYQRLGFVLEGRYRKCHFHERKWWDVLLFSMLEDEWEALREKERLAAPNLVKRDVDSEQA